MGAATSAQGKKRQTGAPMVEKESSVFHEAFTQEVCDACYLNPARLQKRMMRVPTRNIRLAGRNASYSALLMRGIYPWDPTKPCQDSFFVSENIVVDGVSSHWFAVMDGHGSDGHGCALYVRENLEKVARKIHKQQPQLGICEVLSIASVRPRLPSGPRSTEQRFK